MRKEQTGITGEFWFFSQLHRLGYEAYITLGNTNKRRKEEATKVTQLRATYGDKVKFVLFLCGYFDSGYLGYEAAEGIDWVWEHRIDDLKQLGL
jgi:hypothetical protein